MWWNPVAEDDTRFGCRTQENKSVMELDSARRLHAGCLLVPRCLTAFWLDFRATPQAGTGVRYCKPGVKAMGKESQVSVGKRLLLFCWVGVTLSNCLLHICALPIGHCFCQLQSAMGGNFLFTVVYHKSLITTWTPETKWLLWHSDPMLNLRWRKIIKHLCHPSKPQGMFWKRWLERM